MLDRHAINVALERRPHNLIILNISLSGIYAFLPRPADMLMMPLRALLEDPCRDSCNLNAGCFCVISISTPCGLSSRRMMLVVSRRRQIVLGAHHLPSACR